MIATQHYPNPDKPFIGGQAGNSKPQISNPKQITMTKIQNPKREYALERRTFQFYVLVIKYCNLRFNCYLVLDI